jgi:chaperone required for assembly of F1-ATPase
MPTVQEKAAEIVRKVESALRSDGFTKQAAQLPITESVVRRSKTAATLKEVEGDISVSLDGDQIIDAAAKQLRVPPHDLRRMLKEAGNDNYLSLVELIDRLRGR